MRRCRLAHGVRPLGTVAASSRAAARCTSGRRTARYRCARTARGRPDSRASAPGREGLPPPAAKRRQWRAPPARSAPLPASRLHASRRPASPRRSAAAPPSVARQKRQERDLFGLLVGGTAVYALLVLWLGVDGAIAGGWLEDVARGARRRLRRRAAAAARRRRRPALRPHGARAAAGHRRRRRADVARRPAAARQRRDVRATAPATTAAGSAGRCTAPLGGVIGDAGVTLLALVLTAGGLLLATGASVAAVAARSHQELRLAARTVREAWPPPRPAEPEPPARVPAPRAPRRTKPAFDIEAEEAALADGAAAGPRRPSPPGAGPAALDDDPPPWAEPDPEPEPEAGADRRALARPDRHPRGPRRAGAHDRLPAARPVGARPLAAGADQRRRARAGRRRADRGAAALRRRGAHRRHRLRPARHPLRAQARAGHQGRQGGRAARRPRVRPRHHRDPHPRADPGQAGRRRRGAQPVAQHGHPRRHPRRLPARLVAAHGLAGQGHLRQRRARRPRAHAAHPHRRHDRLGQVGLPQRDAGLDPAQRHARGGAADPDRPQARRAQPLRGHPAPADARRHQHEGRRGRSS